MVTQASRAIGFRSATTERGAVLITGLVFLVVLLMIVVSVMRSGTLEERMASNARDRQIALQAAEAASREAAVTFFTNPIGPMDPFDISGFKADCTGRLVGEVTGGGLCALPGSGTPMWKAIAWDSNAVTRTFASASSKLQTAPGVFLPDASQPRYFVELAGFEGGQDPNICPKVIYRVTARGVGKDNSTVFIETMYRHRPHSFIDGSCGGT
jgi:type IV pilus assembly protein PilX